MKPTAEPSLDRLSTLDLDIDGINGGQSVFTNEQMLQWCNEGKAQMPQHPDLGCARNVTANVGRQVTQDNLNAFSAALDRALPRPTK
jgi:hypothetical protein